MQEFGFAAEGLQGLDERADTVRRRIGACEQARIEGHALQIANAAECPEQVCGREAKAKCRRGIAAHGFATARAPPRARPSAPAQAGNTATRAVRGGFPR